MIRAPCLPGVCSTHKHVRPPYVRGALILYRHDGIAPSAVRGLTEIPSFHFGLVWY